MIELLKEIKKSLIVDEWIWANFNEKIVRELSEVQAFESIQYVIKEILNEEQGVIIVELFEILLTLARASNTTEIPDILQRNWSSLEMKIAGRGRYAEMLYQKFLSYYHLTPN